MIFGIFVGFSEACKYRYENITLFVENVKKKGGKNKLLTQRSVIFQHAVKRGIF